MSDAVIVENLTMRYKDLVVVNNLNLSIKTGEVLGLLGANGAGKSTSIDCILGTKKPETGVISINGLNPRRSRKQLFEKVGVQFQEGNYQEKIKVKEICQVTASLYKHPASFVDLLQQFGIYDKMNNFVSNLSGGERQRLFIVLALIPKPKVVFFDEITTGLDPKARRDVWERLKKLKEEGLTILLTSHFMDEVEMLCDKICILKKGKTVFYGTVENAITQSPFATFEDAYLWFTEED